MESWTGGYTGLSDSAPKLQKTLREMLGHVARCPRVYVTRTSMMYNIKATRRLVAISEDVAVRRVARVFRENNT